MIRKAFTLLTISALIVILAASCVQNQTTFSDTNSNVFETNKVYNNIEGVADAQVNYAAFFPESYTGKQKLPVLILLDPHGQGEIPVAKYADIANKHNYILVGSNLNRNGLSSDISENYLKDILKDIKSRFQFDNERIFIGGFSGGAKLAILYADKLPQIKGALACGGSLPMSFNQEPNYYYVGIIGNKDFNYLEMRQSFSVFDQYGFDYTAVVFDGKHEWPPLESFEMGLIGFDIYSAKIGKSTLSDDWKEQVLARMNDSALLYQAQNKFIEEYEILQQTRRWFYGIEPVTEIQKRIAITTQTQAFNKELRARQALIQQEVKLRSEFIKALESRNFEWWQTEVDKINKSANKNSQSFIVKQRLLNYISMAAYMLIKNDLNDEELDAAMGKIRVYELVDPTNPDVYLMYAKYYMIQGQTEEMKTSLVKAKELGLKVNDAYKQDEFWAVLFSNY